LKSGALLLAVHDEWTRNGGDSPEGSETLPIVFDAEPKGSIQLGISAGVLETNYFPDVKASRLIFPVLFASSVAVVQLAAQQTNADQKPIEELKAKAEGGDAESQVELGLRYDKGEGVVKDNAEAVKWYRKAAEQNDAAAQYNLAVCYERGDGVAEDWVEGYKWLLLAARQGVEAPKEHMTVLESRLLTPEQIAQGQKRAREFKPR
jgi:TPR repeat protein